MNELLAAEHLVDLSVETHGHLADFQQNRVELKPGINADTIDSDWRCNLIEELAAHQAVHSSAKRKRGNVWRIAEVLVHEEIYSQFTKPQPKQYQSGHFIAGRFWYVGPNEFQEAAGLCSTSHKVIKHIREFGCESPDSLDPFTLAYMKGFLIGLDRIDRTAERLRKVQDPRELRHLRETVIGLFFHCNGAHFEDPFFQKAAMAILSFSPRKPSITPDLAADARRLYGERHKRVQAARREYTKHKGSAAWSKHVEIEDKKSPGKPKIPITFIHQLPDKSPREIALEWTAEDLNRHNPRLAATANTVRRLMEAAQKADMQKIRTTKLRNPHDRPFVP